MSGVQNAPALSSIDFDPAKLRAWLDKALPDTRGPLEIERVGGGQSNPTYFVTAGARQMVLRKRPPGELVKGAHDVGREFRIIKTLYGTQVPVPEPILYHDEPDVVGTAFYLMDRLNGRIFHDCSLPMVPIADRRACYRELARTLAALHAVDWRATELASFARPGSFLARQVDRWSRAWGPAVSEDPDVAHVSGWLHANVPAVEELAIVHGDYKFTNMIFAPAEPKILAVLDWELCTIGDPLLDLGHIWAFQWQTLPEEYGGVLGTDLEALGLPGFAEFAEDYYAAAQSPRRITRFHFVLGHFRAAGIFHGIGERAASGIANAGNAEEKGRLDRIYLRRALAAISDALPL